MSKHLIDHRGLSPKQQRFVDEYLVLLNAQEAALRAGYNKSGAHVRGCQLLQTPVVAAAIRAAMAERAARTRVTADRVIEGLARIAFADLGRVADWGPDGLTLKPNAALAEADRVSIAEIAANSAPHGKGRNKNGAGRIRIRLQDKQRALDSLARHLALYGKNAAAIAPTDPKAREAAAQRARALISQRLANLARGRAEREARLAAEGGGAPGDGEISEAEKQWLG